MCGRQRDKHREQKTTPTRHKNKRNEVQELKVIVSIPSHINAEMLMLWRYSFRAVIQTVGDHPDMNKGWGKRLFEVFPIF